MLSLLSSKRAAARASQTPPVDQEATGVQVDLRGAIRSISQQASTIGRESAEVRGLLDDTTKASERGVLAVASLTAQVKDINVAQASIGVP